MRAVLDTSWLYAFFDRSDAFHSVAREQAADVHEAFVPLAILGEAMTLMHGRKGLGRKAAIQALRAMEGTPQFRLAEPAHDHEATSHLFQTHRGLTYCDAAAVEAARRLGVTLLTFDRAQQKAAQAKVAP